MTEGSPADTAPVSARFALAVAAAFTLTVGALAGRLPMTGAGVVGALAMGWGADALTGDRPARIAAGSIAVAVGGGAAVVAGFRAVAVGPSVLGILVTATVVVAVEALAGLSADIADALEHAAVETGAVTLVGAVGAVAWFVLVAAGAGPAAVAGTVALATGSLLAALVSLQLGVLASGLLVGRAVDALRTLTDGVAAGESEWSLAERFRIDRSAVPGWYRAALAVQVLLAAWPPTAVVAEDLAAQYVTARPVLSAVVDAVVLSGVLHGAVLAALVSLALVAAAPTCRRVVVGWTGDSPVETAAFAAGGFVAVALAAAIGVLSAVGVVGVDLMPGPVAGTVGSLAPLLAGVLALVAAAVVAVLAVRAVTNLVDPTGRGFASGAVLVFVATLAAADAVPALVTVAGVGASLLVWDAGVHAVALRRDLGTVTPDDLTEYVHATATTLAVLLGVGVAVAVGALVVPLASSVPGDRATAALTLALLSVLAFGVALRR